MLDNFFVRIIIHSVYFLLALHLSASARKLPIYIEDSHAGSFGFFAQTLDLEKSYTLILIDEHSDASGVPGSDRVRKALRRVTSVQQRKENVDKLRQDGTIQPFNWIEPLMPQPISKVIWIAGESLSDAQIVAKQKEARLHLDWHTQAEARTAGLLAERYVVTDWERFSEQMKREKLGDIVLTIDLDYFVNLPQPTKNLKQKWSVLIQFEGLEAVSFALSMPWQKDQQTAAALLHTAFESAFSVAASSVQFEPYLTDLKDRSEKAKSYFKRGLKAPRYRIDQATQKLRNLLVRKQSCITVKHNPLAWEAQLRAWSKGTSKHELEIRTAQQSIDKVWRLQHVKLDDIWLKSPVEEVIKVRWWLHRPVHRSYNIIPNSRLGKGFAENAPAYVVSHRTLIAETQDQALASRTWRKYLHTKAELGIVKMQAELVMKNSSVFTDVIEIRVRRQDGFLGALEEQFGSPYVFGIGSFRQAGESGAETLLGNDCANFLIYAFRRNGKQLPWCNPAQIKQFLEPIKETVKVGDTVHLGSHVAVLYEDKGTLGKLDDRDILVHHLSGFPECITLGKLAKGKPYTAMRYRQSKESVSLTLGGDICLHGQVTPSAAKVMIANLECVISDHAEPIRNKRFQYIVPLEKAAILQNYALLSLANNHAGDGGSKGLRDTIDYLEKNEIKHVGAGKIADAVRIKTLVINGIKIGFLGINLIEQDTLPAQQNTIGVATYPAHKTAIHSSIQQARKEGVSCIIALPHWGDEYTTKVNEAQRNCARWLIENGVDIIVGSHPHRLQHHAFYRGKLIVYSMGNLIIAPQKQPGFNQRSVINISLTESGELAGFKLTGLAE
ncbi:MAG: hypothetical protein ACI9SQ_001143 [Rubritalea sp.]